MSTEVALVLVVTGTDKHPFDRLVRWVDDWLTARTGPPIRCVVQYGTSRPSVLAEGAAYLDHATMEDLMRRSQVIVSHGGPTTISEARRLGHRPLVVPRRASRGEHVDDHQFRFTNRLVESGLVDIAEDPAQLAEAIERGLTRDGASDPEVPGQVPQSDAAHAAAAFAVVVDSVLQAPRPGLLRARSRRPRHAPRQ